MDDFFLRALAGGIGVALAAGPIGCFVVWRRMAYFGAALAHSALLGIALGFVLGFSLTVGILLLCLGLATLLALLERQRLLPADTLLGVLAHVTLAAGIVLVAQLDTLRVDLMSYLFGDVLAVGAGDLVYIYATAAIGLAVLAWLWNDLLALTVNEDLAAVEGVNVARVRVVFVLLLAAVIAVGMKIVGMLLVVSLVIIPAAAARRMSASPEQMALLAALVGVASVVAGLFGSLHLDVPSGPFIVTVAAAIFVAALAWPGRRPRQYVSGM